MDYYLRTKTLIHDPTDPENKFEEEDCFSPPFNTPEDISSAVDELNLHLQREVVHLKIDGRGFLFKVKAALQDTENKLAPIEASFDAFATFTGETDEIIHKMSDHIKRELWLLLPLELTSDSILYFPEDEEEEGEIEAIETE